MSVGARAGRECAGSAAVSAALAVASTCANAVRASMGPRLASRGNAGLATYSARRICDWQCEREAFSDVRTGSSEWSWILSGTATSTCASRACPGPPFSTVALAYEIVKERYGTVDRSPRRRQPPAASPAHRHDRTMPGSAAARQADYTPPGSRDESHGRGSTGCGRPKATSDRQRARAGRTSGRVRRRAARCTAVFMRCLPAAAECQGEFPGDLLGRPCALAHRADSYRILTNRPRIHTAS